MTKKNKRRIGLIKKKYGAGLRLDKQVRAALENAIRQADAKAVRPWAAPDPSNKADAAIRKLRRDRRLTREELDMPTRRSEG